ncbi:MAG TPA: alginate lyase family protein, partial [Opitutales bacterium]|nr:alginate lyase family protein [Opitutales bacterium]
MHTTGTTAAALAGLTLLTTNLPATAFTEGGMAEAQVSVETSNARARLDPEFVRANEDRLRTLLGQLDLGRPGLEECAAPAARGDLQGACEALVAYYEAVTPRISTGTLSREAGFETLIRASDALEGVFTQQNSRAEAVRRPDGGIDWGSAPGGDKEWVWFLNRHQFLRDLAEAYLSTGRDIYGEALSGYIADWVLANPFPGRLNFSPQWRALEAARRITDSWTDIFFSHDLPLSPEARLLMLASIPDHAADLSDHGSFWGGNHRLTEQSALAEIAVAWPEFRDSDKWLDKAVAVTRREILSGSYPDGAFTELTNHYQRIVLESLERMLSILADAGRVEPDLEERAQTMWDYFASVTRPDGNGPLNNDGDMEWNASLVPAAALAHSRPDWLYVASCGARGTKPSEPPSRYFPYAGHAVMRNGWDENAQWAFLDLGPNGSAHAHADRMSMELSLGQHEILVDNGRYTYEPGPWKDYFAGPAAHNVVLVNGHGAVPPPAFVTKPLPVTAIIREHFDFFAASESYPGDSLSGRGGATHTRSVFYKSGSYWLVADSVIAFGPTALRTLWHFHPDVVVTREGDDIMAWADESLALRIRQVYGPETSWEVQRGKLSPIQGWHSPDYNTRWPASCAVADAVTNGPS